MCGILFCYCHDVQDPVCHEAGGFGDGTENKSSSEYNTLKEVLNDPVLENRGPDISKQLRLSLSDASMHGWMRGCVLHLRGQPTPQPLTDDEGNALLWNGEIFDGIEVSRNENDTQVLFELLTKCQTDDDILRTLEQIHGPWAFIFWQAKRKILWFGRDMFGRRSLLWHLPATPKETLVLTSVAVGNLDYTEVPSVGIFGLDLSYVNMECSPQLTPTPLITLYPWHMCKWPGSTQSVLATQPHELDSFIAPNRLPSIIPIIVDKQQILKNWIPSINKTLSSKDESSSSEKLSCEKMDLVSCLENVVRENGNCRSLSEQLITVLQEAVMKRVNNLPVGQDVIDTTADDSGTSKAKIAVLFSGGLDSSVIAALLDRCLPPEEPIDLLNVAFEQPSPSHSQAKKKQKQKRPKKSEIRPKQEKSEKNSDSLLDDCKGVTDTNSTIPDNLQSRSSHGLPETSSSYTSKDSVQDPSSQIYMCEENSCKDINSKCNIKETSSLYQSQAISIDPYDVPDRQTGRIALSELNPNRKWNFIEVDVSQEELKSMRSSCVGKLIYPLQTVLDDSIGCAVWFAARGKGRLANHGGQHFVSKAKVILCGMGADEQFAGYSRHRAHFNQWGEESLVRQLEQEIWRISARNLGRDDRIIADHGKEARFPFLDEKFTKLVSEIPVHMRANLHLPRGLGEKLLLRISAFTLELRQTACQPKRAIQFGSKIAKLDDSKEKGSDICQRLL